MRQNRNFHKLWTDDDDDDDDDDDRPGPPQNHFFTIYVGQIWEAFSTTHKINQWELHFDIMLLKQKWFQKLEKAARRNRLILGWWAYDVREGIKLVR